VLPDIDRPLKAAIGTQVVWEDREFFLIPRPQRDTVEGIKAFLAGFRREHEQRK
jgi:hypothetical protein